MPEELSIKQETTDTKIDVDHEVTMKHPALGLSPASWDESVQDRRSQSMIWGVGDGKRGTGGEGKQLLIYRH